MSLTLSKAELRKNLRATSVTSRDEKSSLLSLNIAQFFQSQNVNLKTHVLGVFSPIDSEPLWFKSFDEKILHELKLAYPAVGGAYEMHFKLTQMSQLVKSISSLKNSLLEPPVEAPIVNCDYFLVPGLAFTPEGKRLGRGKGYYDRYLKNERGLKIGIAFEEQILSDLPTEDHDVLMDFIISESRVIKVSEES